MSQVTLYRFKEVMDEDFPFKIEIHGYDQINLRLHAHEHLQLCYIRKGACTHQVGGKQATLVKGDIYFIPPFLEHRNIPIKDTEIEMIQIDFMPVFINENMRDLSSLDGFVDYAYIQPFVTVHDEMLPKLNITLTNQMAIEQLIDNICKELQTKEEGFRFVIKADLLKLLIIVGREYSNFISGRKEKQIIAIHRRAFYETLEYMKDNFREENKLDQMAAKAAMSPTYFSYMFKLMTGKTYIEHLNQLRIQEAMNQLKSTDKSVTEIGLSIGFNHLGHFTRMFKKQTGVTPSEYRKTGAYGETKIVIPQ